MQPNIVVDAEILRESARQFVTRNYAFSRRQQLAIGPTDVANWKAFAELGWLGAGLPEDVGGIGGSIAETALVFEELGKALVVEPILGSAVLAAQTFNAAATGEQRAETLPALAAGARRLALAHEETGARGEPGAVSLEAGEHAGGYRLTGVKIAVLGAPGADALLVSARLSGGGPIVLFEVAPYTPGVALTPYTGYDGLRAANIAFSNVEIPASVMIGSANTALAALEHGYAQAMLAEGAYALGVMQTALTATAEYLKTRRQFGQALSEFQALRHRLVDIYIQIEEARALHEKCIAFASHGHQPPKALLAQMALCTARAGRFVGMQSVQLHGGIGMTSEYVVGHCCRYLIASGLRFGGMGRHLDIIADELSGAAAA